MSAQSMESQITCEMDVFTPTHCSVEHDSSMMNNVMGNESVPGHCFFNAEIFQLRVFLLWSSAKEQCLLVYRGTFLTCYLQNLLRVKCYADYFSIDLVSRMTFEKEL